MAAETMCKLPVIDLSDLKQGSLKWETVKTQVRQALEEYGCFEAFCDDIPRSLRDAVFDGVGQIFDLPLEIKERNKSDVAQGRGYAKQPSYEGIGIGNWESHQSFTPEKIESFTNCFWPDGGNPTLSKNMHSLSEKLCEAEQNVRRMIVESFDLEKYMDKFMKSAIYDLQFNKYYASHGGLSPHTDMGILTVVWSNPVAGLEILIRDDDQWVDVDLSPNHFMVFAGDTFHAWTNGRLHSVMHRVKTKEDVARYSIVLYSVAKKGYTIEVPEELVDEEHPILFKPYDPSKFWEYYFSEALGKNPHTLLKELYGA